MPEPVLEEIKAETKKTHTAMMEAVTDFKAAQVKLEALETKVGEVPSDLTETLAKIDTSIDAFDTKHADLITQYEAVEQKLNDLEAAGVDTKAVEEKLAEEHGVEFKSFLRYGVNAGEKGADEKNLLDLQQKSMYAGSDPDGGFVIPRPMSNMIQTAKRDATPFREEASSTTVSGDMFKYLIDIGELASGWVTERAARGKTATPNLHEASIMVHEMYAGPALTQNVLDDAAFPLESWLSGKVGESFGNLEAYAFLLGTGSGQPRGILTYADGNAWGQIQQLETATASVIAADDLIEQQGDLKEAYAANAKWYMNRRTITAIRKLKTDASNLEYMWQPGLQAGAPSTILGDPVVKMNYMPVIADSALSIMFGDLKKAYLIVDRYATRVLRDPYTQTPYVIFKTNGRVGGDVVNFEAVNLTKIKAAA